MIFPNSRILSDVSQRLLATSDTDTGSALNRLLAVSLLASDPTVRSISDRQLHLDEAIEFIERAILRSAHVYPQSPNVDKGLIDKMQKEILSILDVPDDKVSELGAPLLTLLKVGATLTVSETTRNAFFTELNSTLMTDSLLSTEQALAEWTGGGDFLPPPQIIDQGDPSVVCGVPFNVLTPIINGLGNQNALSKKLLSDYVSTLVAARFKLVLQISSSCVKYKTL